MIISEAISNIRIYWHLITKKFQSIFLYLQWFDKTYIHAFPALDTIAEACKCSRRTVTRAIAFFTQNNWITKIKRPYQSNIYQVHPDLLNFDCFDSNNFKKEIVPQVGTPNVQQIDPVLESSNQSIESTCTEDVPDIGSKNLAKPKIHPCLARLKLTDQEKASLTAKFAEYHLANAIDDAKWYEKQGKKILNVLGFIYSQANKSLKRLRA